MHFVGTEPAAAARTEKLKAEVADKERLRRLAVEATARKVQALRSPLQAEQTVCSMCCLEWSIMKCISCASELVPVFHASILHSYLWSCKGRECCGLLACCLPLKKCLMHTMCPSALRVYGLARGPWRACHASRAICRRSAVPHCSGCLPVYQRGGMTCRPRVRKPGACRARRPRRAPSWRASASRARAGLQLGCMRVY